MIKILKIINLSWLWFVLSKKQIKSFLHFKTRIVYRRVVNNFSRLFNNTIIKYVSKTFLPIDASCSTITCSLPMCLKTLLLLLLYIYQNLKIKYSRFKVFFILYVVMRYFYDVFGLLVLLVFTNYISERWYQTTNNALESIFSHISNYIGPTSQLVDVL